MQKLVNKAISPAEFVKALVAGDITIEQAQAMYNGVIPIGDQGGIAKLYDIDKQVIQPLVNAELAHILGILDGRLEGYDLRTITPPIGQPTGSTMTGTLKVPAGEVWYVSAVRTSLLTTGTANSLLANWACDLWPDTAITPNPSGKPFQAVGFPLAAGQAVVRWLDEFGPIATAWLITNKVSLLRLPADTVITFILTLGTANATAAVASTLQLYGFVGKSLVA